MMSETSCVIPQRNIVGLIIYRMIHAVSFHHGCVYYSSRFHTLEDMTGLSVKLRQELISQTMLSSLFDSVLTV